MQIEHRRYNFCLKASYFDGVFTIDTLANGYEIHQFLKGIKAGV